MEKYIVAGVIIVVVYGLVIWGLLKFHRWHLKKTILKTFREAVDNGSITKEQGDLLERVVNDVYKHKTWKKY